MAKSDSNTPEARVQQETDKATEQGFIGVKADPTPNEAYTVKGVLAGQPTPETDDATADAANAHLRKIATDGSL